MLDHSSRSTLAPGPSGSGLWVGICEPLPLKQGYSTTFVFKSMCQGTQLVLQSRAALCKLVFESHKDARVQNWACFVPLGVYSISQNWHFQESKFMSSLITLFPYFSSLPVSVEPAGFKPSTSGWWSFFLPLCYPHCPSLTKTQYKISNCWMI